MTCCSSASGGVPAYRGSWKTPELTWEIWGDMGRYGEIWGDMGRYGVDMGGYDLIAHEEREIWGDMGRYGGIWGDMGTYGGI